jgi:hypothetical protein
VKFWVEQLQELEVLQVTWEDNIKMDSKEVEREVGGIYLAQDRDQWWDFVYNLRTFRFHEIWGIS